MAINIPGYAEVFEDSVYGVDGTSAIGGNLVLTRELLLLKRFVEPREDDVVDYLQKKTGEVEGIASLVLPAGSRTRGKSGLETAIIALPAQVRRDIRTGKGECLEFVRMNTPAPANDGGGVKEFVNIKYGVVPSAVITKNQEEGNINSSDWYFMAFVNEGLKERGFGGRFNINILLNNRTLPKKGDIDVLIEHGAYSSRTFDVNRSYDSREMRAIVDLVYAGLPGEDEIRRLRDASDNILEELTLVSVMALHQQLQKGLRTGT